MSQGDSGKIIKDQSSLGQFNSAIAQICEEKGIDKDKVVASIEAALAAAYKKDYGRKGQIVIAKMDENTSETSFKRLREVVDETTRLIEDEFISEEARQIPKSAVKSEEKMEHRERAVVQEAENEEEKHLPKFNPERDVLLEDARKVVPDIEVGDYIEYPLEVKDQYGRIASQTAKQVIIQKIREAERESMYEEFKGREGEIINGTVQRIESGRVFVDLGKSVGVLFPSEQIPGEEYRIGQRLKLYIDKVDSDPKSLGIKLSRRHPQLLVKLFELEVPEIFAGTVEIKAVAREAGQRSKIAVASNEEGIDPVGSCVGQKGTRVQAIIDELNGEKIDIIEWVDNTEEMIERALAPAKVVKVELLEGVDAQESIGKEKEVAKDDEEAEEMEEIKKAVAYVKDDQLSLAIGKRGQNVRLAAKLTGWNINVESLDVEEEEDTTKSDKKVSDDDEQETQEMKQVKKDGENEEVNDEKKKEEGVDKNDAEEEVAQNEAEDKKSEEKDQEEKEEIEKEKKEKKKKEEEKKKEEKVN